MKDTVKEGWKERLNKEFFDGIPTENMGSNQVDEKRLQEFIKKEISISVSEAVKEIKEWANTKKEKLVMKWDNDKAKSTVYDSIIFGYDGFPKI